MNALLAYFIYTGHGLPGAAVWVINILIYLVVLLIVFAIVKIAAAEFQVSPGIVKLVGLILFLAFVLVLVSGCSTTQQKQIQDNLAQTDITGGVTYSGATVTIGRVNGRQSVNVSVDAKRVQRDIQQVD